MAWNDVPAKDDIALRYQAYYVRLNALRQFLSPLSAQMFETAWDAISSDDMRNFRRSAIAGQVMADLIRALGLDEITEVDIPVGSWFVHSGVTTYAASSNGRQSAFIALSDGQLLEGAVWPDCRITATARANMDGKDDVSLVVGRRISKSRFDLVAAGYRDPIAHFYGTGLSETGNGSHLPSLELPPHGFMNQLPSIGIRDTPDFGTLAYAVADTVKRFSVAVQRQGAWKLLYEKDGKPAHESRHQSLFRLFSHLTFSALDIVLHPNADHGRGPTDLTLALREAVHVAEFKKDNSPGKIVHGLQVQLPRYLESAGTIFGTYIVMCHERTVAEVSEIIRDKNPEDFVIEVFVIDCRRQRSASKAE